MAWTDEMVEDLKKMWHEGLTTGEIGKRLGVSKNSIVGKVHRLQLSGRPSPIKKKDEENTEVKTAAAPKAEKTAAPAKPEKSAPAAKSEKKSETEFPAAKAETHAENVSAAPEKTNRYQPRAAYNNKTSLTDLDNHTCRWPLGDPKDENFHFCGKKVKIGQTYCDEHAGIAYVKTGKK